MSIFDKRPTEMGYQSLDEERKRLAMMVCAAKRIIEACKAVNRPLNDEELRVVTGVGYDIYFAAKHFSLVQSQFEMEVGQLAQQFLDNGSYAKEADTFNEEHPEELKEMKKKVKQQNREYNEAFAGDGSYTSNVKH